MSSDLPDTRRGSRWSPRRWTVWSLPGTVQGYVLTVDAFAGLVVVMALIRTSATAGQWVTAAVLVASAVVHLHASHAVERVRRDHSHTPHVDLCSVWIFAGALVLPALPEIVLVVVIYLHRWVLVGRWDASRPWHKTVFTTAMMILTTTVSGAVAAGSGLREHLGIAPSGWTDSVALLGAIGTQWVVNAALVAAVLWLATRPNRVRDVFPSPADNLLELSQLVLGVFMALALLWLPLVAPLMVIPILALHQTVLLHQLKLAARTDHRTGLLHAVAWQEQATVELQRAHSERRSFALLLLDLDLFKRVNDTHGHLVGDDVLREFAAMLTATVRRGDAVGRYGGEEFAVLQPDISEAAAVAVAERIRRSARDLRVSNGNGGWVQVSVTIGVAIWPDIAEDTIHGLLHAADAALYAGKRSGRNCVHVAGNPYRYIPDNRTT